MLAAFRSDASDVGVGGYSIDGFPPGRCIRRIQGNQYRKTILTWRAHEASHDAKSKVKIIMKVETKGLVETGYGGKGIRLSNPRR